MELEKTSNSYDNFEEKRAIILLAFNDTTKWHKLILRGIRIKVDSWINEVELKTPKQSPHTYRYLICAEGSKIQCLQWRKKSLLNWTLKKLDSLVKKNEADDSLSAYTKINSKWIQELDQNHENNRR